MILSETAPGDDAGSLAGGAPCTRFAPSPTGLLHLGHAHAALVAWSRARGAGGRFVLRIEDIDPQRCRAAYAEAILDDLAWLGLEWEQPVLVQSAHLAAYGAVLDQLREEGLLYPCFCSRAAVLAEQVEALGAPHRAPDGAVLYPGTCRRLDRSLAAERIAGGAPHVLRLDMQAALARVRGTSLFYEDADAPPATRRVACRPEAFGDLVLGRCDVPASYHLCVTHDDWRQGVSLVTRGEDLRPATDVHRLLQALLGWAAPAYAHHRVLRDADGRRLSKRDGAQTLRAMREAGVSPDLVRARAGFA